MGSRQRGRRALWPCGHDSGLMLPLMKLPRIAYRKSIKPSQIFPPSRRPARRHDITSWQRLLAPVYCTYQCGTTYLPSLPRYPMARTGLCSLPCRVPCYSMVFALWPGGTAGTARPGSLVWVPSAPPQNSHGIVPNSCTTQPSQRNQAAPTVACPTRCFSVDCKLACLGYPI